VTRSEPAPSSTIAVVVQGMTLRLSTTKSGERLNLKRPT